MHSPNYKVSLTEALKTLVKCNEIIYDSLIHIETQGKLKDWNDSVPVGEIHQFDFPAVVGVPANNINSFPQLFLVCNDNGPMVH